MESSSEVYSLILFWLFANLYSDIPVINCTFWMNLRVFSPTVPPHIPSIYFFPHPKVLQMRRDWRTGHLSWSSSKSLLVQDIWKSLTNGYGVDAGVLQHVTNAFGMHRTGTASLENTCRNEQGPGFFNSFIKAQTVASNRQKNLTHSVVESDTWKQPEMEMRKVSITFMLILAQNLLHVGLTRYIPQRQQI